MWVLLSLLSALGAALTNLSLKRTVADGGVMVSTVAFRIVAGLLLAGIVVAGGAWPVLTPGYWRATAMVLPPEIGGMVCMGLALRAGDLSLVQPMMGLIPLFVMVGGVVLLHEVPTPAAGAGILLVTAGVYCIGLEGGRSVLGPLRALARSKASWYAVGAVVCWSLTTLVHKIGIAEVGAFPWAVTLVLGSALVLAAFLPFLRRRPGALGLPAQPKRWAVLVLCTALAFTLQQAGLHLALRITQAGYVMAITSMSILLATGLGIVLLGERSAARNRLVGGALVTLGAVCITLFG